MAEVDKDAGGRQILRINMRFAGAVVVLAYGWAAWQIASKEMWGFGLLAVLCAIGGGTMVLRGVIDMVGIIRRRGKLGSFAARGDEVKADKMAATGDLKSRGMIR